MYLYIHYIQFQHQIEVPTNKKNMYQKYNFNFNNYNRKSVKLNIKFTLIIKEKLYAIRHNIKQSKEKRKKDRKPFIITYFCIVQL